MPASNTLLTPTVIAKEALMMLMNNLVMGKLVHREYQNEFAKVGTSIKIRKPVRFAVTKSATRTNTNVVEYSETFTVTTQAHVSWAFTSAQLTQTIEEYSARYIQPAAAELANTVDYDLCSLYNKVGNSQGTPGTTPSTFAELGACQQMLDELAAANPRVAVVNPASHWSLADGLKGTFAQKPANDIFTKGYLGTVAGLDFHMDQNIRRHTTGAFTTSCTPVVTTASVAGAYTLVTQGWLASAAVLLAGDAFTVDAVYSVNPKSRESTGQLKHFVSLNDETASSGGSVTIDFMSSTSEGLHTSGAYHNIDAYPQIGAALNMIGSESTLYPQNLIFHPNAFGLVTLPIAMPAGVWGARVTDKANGMSIRIVKDYDIYYDEEIIRMDILYGTAGLYPEMACRLWG